MEYGTDGDRHPGNVTICKLEGLLVVQAFESLPLCWPPFRRSRKARNRSSGNAARQQWQIWALTYLTNRTLEATVVGIGRFFSISEQKSPHDDLDHLPRCLLIPFPVKAHDVIRTWGDLEGQWAILQARHFKRVAIAIL